MSNFFSKWGSDVRRVNLPTDYYKDDFFVWDRGYLNNPIHEISVQHSLYRGSRTLAFNGETQTGGRIEETIKWQQNPLPEAAPAWDHTFVHPEAEWNFVPNSRCAITITGSHVTTFTFPDGTTEEVISHAGLDVDNFGIARKSALPHKLVYEDPLEIVCIGPIRYDNPIYMKYFLHGGINSLATTPFATNVLDDSPVGAWLYVAKGAARDGQGGTLRRFEFREYDPSTPNYYTILEDKTIILSVVKY